MLSAHFCLGTPSVYRDQKRVGKWREGGRAGPGDGACLATSPSHLSRHPGRGSECCGSLGVVVYLTRPRCGAARGLFFLNAREVLLNRGEGGWDGGGRRTGVASVG
jgi:hypothetical protein